MVLHVSWIVSLIERCRTIHEITRNGHEQEVANAKIKNEKCQMTYEKSMDERGQATLPNLQIAVILLAPGSCLLTLEPDDRVELQTCASRDSTSRAESVEKDPAIRLPVE